MQLTKDTKTHVIIFNDRSKKFISEKAFNSLLMVSSSDTTGFKLDNSYIRFSSIAKIISKDEYHQQYPDKAPQKYDEIKVEDKRSATEKDIYDRKVRRLEGMIKGFKMFVNERKRIVGSVCQKTGKMVDRVIPITATSTRGAQKLLEVHERELAELKKQNPPLR